MTLKLDLSAETERRLRERAEAAGVSPEEFARATLEHAVGSTAAALGPGELPPEEAERRLKHIRAWLAMAAEPPPGVKVDDTRESIYGGRGE